MQNISKALGAHFCKGYVKWPEHPKMSSKTSFLYYNFCKAMSKWPKCYVKPQKAMSNSNSRGAQILRSSTFCKYDLALHRHVHCRQEDQSQGHVRAVSGQQKVRPLTSRQKPSCTLGGLTWTAENKTRTRTTARCCGWLGADSPSLDPPVYRILINSTRVQQQPQQPIAPLPRAFGSLRGGSDVARCFGSNGTP